jgi:hypothetical protein
MSDILPSMIGARRIESREPDSPKAWSPHAARSPSSISTPVVANSKEFEALALQRMERVRDSENSCAETLTICNAQFSPNRLTTEYTRTANPGIMLIRNPQESKLDHCEFNGKMGTPGLCPEVITAAARIKRLTQRGRENRTRETNFKPLITFSRSSRGSDRLLLMQAQLT